MKWHNKTAIPTYENALILVSVFGHTQSTLLKWRKNSFYMMDDNSLFTIEYSLIDQIFDWTYFPLSKKDENYDLYKKAVGA